MPNEIKINDVTLDVRSGHTASFYGRLSDKTLPGIDLNFHVTNPQIVEAIERLASQETIQVTDPFVGQTYPASFRLISHSYTSGQPQHYFTCEVRALDISPEFNVLEIDGDEFPVLASREQIVTEQDQEGIYSVIVLRLTQAQFVAVQQLLCHDELSIRRKGVNEKPLTVRHGSRMYWSKHMEDGETFYKQMVRLVYPSNIPSPKASGIALVTEQDILFRMVMALSARFERLSDELVEAGVISNEKHALLLDDNWKELLDQQCIDEIAQQTYRVADAEDELV
jgi:hypothetical protein